MMQISGWAIVIIIVGVIAVVSVRWMNKRISFKNRKALSFEEMYNQAFVNSGTSYEMFEKILNLLGQAYRIDPRILRPSDKLKALYDLDSWDIGEGTEMLNERIASDFGIENFEIEPRTITELVVEIAKNAKR